MQHLTQSQLQVISGGELVPGAPTPETLCLNTKLMVAAGRNQPGFDVGVATIALMITCPDQFWDEAQTNEYVMTGGMTV